MEPIKVGDKYTLELASKLLGYRILIDNLALMYGNTQLEFWTRLREIYKLDKDKTYHYDHIDKEIREG